MYYRKTVIDLYTERDQVPWYSRPLGILSASMILLGFLVFPASFQLSTNWAVSQGALSIVAVILLALGYSLSVALWFMCTSWLFQLDVLFLPCLSSCVLGTLNIGITLGLHPATGNQWTTSAIAAIILALTSTVVYAMLSLLTHRKIRNVRAHDPLHRTRTNSEAVNLITDDDRVQKQLLGLLQQKEVDKASPDASQSTFRIDIPENSKVSDGARARTSYLAAPSNVYESRNQSMDGSALEDQFSFVRGAVQETAPIDRKLQALERARAKSQQSKAREVSRGPPVIVDSRLPDDIEGIPLSERHPLERGGEFIRGRKSKDEPYPFEGVYRPGDDYNVDAIAPVQRPEVELEDRQRGKRQHLQHRGELEAEVIPRIVRVQTDGWPES